MRMKLIAVTSAALLLTGCAGQADAGTTEPVEGTTAEVEEVTEATPEQLASLIAEHRADFQDAEDGFFDCRLGYVADPESLESVTCYTRQKTIVLISQTTAREMRALAAPASMQSLVDDTLSKLDLIGGANVEACGDYVNLDDEACSSAITGLDVYLGSFSDTLNAWEPYI